MRMIGHALLLRRICLSRNPTTEMEEQGRYGFDTLIYEKKIPVVKYKCSLWLTQLGK
jgi:hypothetical protein